MEMQNREEPTYLNTPSIQQIHIQEKQKKRLPELNTSRAAIILSIVNAIMIIGFGMWTYFWIDQQMKAFSLEKATALGQVMDCQCTKGESGLRGPQGIAMNGTDGESGPPGIDGTPGSKGSTGQRGAKGDLGLKGTAGVKGAQGQKGAAGASGQKGQIGQKGVNGDRGLTGSKGSTGLKSQKGVKGESAGITHGDVRLGGKRLTAVGATTLAGVLEVFYDTSWGYVCDDYFGSNDARVVCRNLGMDYVSYTTRYRLSTTVTDFPLANLGCNGNEERLTQCDQVSTAYNCNYSEGVYVTCRL